MSDKANLLTVLLSMFGKVIFSLVPDIILFIEGGGCCRSPGTFLGPPNGDPPRPFKFVHYAAHSSVDKAFLHFMNYKE